MYSLSEKQIDYILDDIRARGVEMEDLQLNLLDHVCCIIENNLEADGNFEEFYTSTIKTFYKDALWEIEEETINLLIFKNYYVMKKLMIVTGTISAVIMSAGIFFKFMHWPGASIMIVLGIVLLSLLFLPLLFTLKAKEKQKTKEKITLAIATFAGILISLSVLFKIMHWPGANFMGLLFIIIMIAVYIPLYFFTGIKNPEMKVNTIVTSILMYMGCGLFLTLVNSRPYIQERSTLVTDSYLQKSYEVFDSKVEEYFTALNKDTLSKKNLSDLHVQVSSICDHIDKMKLELATATQGVPLQKINYADLDRSNNYNIPTAVLFHDDQTPAEPLAQLKQKLAALNVYCEERFQFNSSSIIDLNEVAPERPDAKGTWEARHFYRTPLINVLRNLTILQMNLRFIEAQLL